jgi:hypothetical protein
MNGMGDQEAGADGRSRRQEQTAGADGRSRTGGPCFPRIAIACSCRLLLPLLLSFLQAGVFLDEFLLAVAGEGDGQLQRFANAFAAED